MAKPSIANITVTQTFQNWFDKTNEMVDLFQSEVMTASSTGDTTVGDAILSGDFTATNLIASTLLQSDTVQSRTNGGDITFNSPTIHLAGTDQISATFSFAANGGRTRYTDGSISWDVGMEDSTNANFIIDTGAAPRKFLLTPAGTLYVPNIILGEDLSSNNINNTDTITTENLIANNITFTGQIDGDIDFGSDVFIDGDLTVDGNGYFTGDVVTNYSLSDIRLKENLEQITDAVNKVSQINGYFFNYIDKPEQRVSGVVAQELEKVLPEVVFDSMQNNGSQDAYKAVRYDNIIPLLIEAIKELNEKIERLENRS